jgi:hypothetical protein
VRCHDLQARGVKAVHDFGGDRAEAGVRVVGANCTACLDHLLDRGGCEQHAARHTIAGFAQLLHEPWVEGAADQLNARRLAARHKAAEGCARARAFQLDIQAHVSAHQIQHLHQGRHAQTAQVDAFDIGHAPRIAEEPQQRRIVDHNDLTVPAQVHVQLREVEAPVDSQRERAQRVLGRQRARATMTDR